MLAAGGANPVEAEGGDSGGHSSGGIVLGLPLLQRAIMGAAWIDVEIGSMLSHEESRKGRAVLVARSGQATAAMESVRERRPPQPGQAMTSMPVRWRSLSAHGVLGWVRSTGSEAGELLPARSCLERSSFPETLRPASNPKCRMRTKPRGRTWRRKRRRNSRAVRVMVLCCPSCA